MQFWLTGSAIAVMALAVTLPLVHSQSSAGLARFGEVVAATVAAVWFGWVLPAFPTSSQSVTQALAMPIGAVVVVVLGTSVIQALTRHSSSAMPSAGPLRASPGPQASMMLSAARLGPVQEPRVPVPRPLTRDSRYDALTGLPGRVLLVDRTSMMIARARRTQESVALAIIMLGVHGEPRGRQLPTTALLSEVGSLLSMALREEDTVACLQPDRLAVVAQIKPEPGRSVLEERLGRALSSFARRSDLDVRVGIALFPEHAAYVAQLMSRAEKALEDAEPL